MTWRSIRVKEQRNILHEISKRKANWIGHILRRNCRLQRVIEGKIKGRIDVTGRRGRRSRKLLDDLKERRRYSHLKEETLDRPMWTARFGRGVGPFVRQTTKWMNEWMNERMNEGWWLFISSSPRMTETFASLEPDCLFFCNHILEEDFLWSQVSFCSWSSCSLFL